jgi:hypothetical protein
LHDVGYRYQPARQRFGLHLVYAAAHHRLHPDPKCALAATASNAKVADPDGWPTLQQQLVTVLRHEG